MENLKSLSPKRTSHAQAPDCSGVQVHTCSPLWGSNPFSMSDSPQNLNSRQLLPAEHTYRNSEDFKVTYKSWSTQEADAANLTNNKGADSRNKVCKGNEQTTLQAAVRSDTVKVTQHTIYVTLVRSEPRQSFLLPMHFVVDGRVVCLMRKWYEIQSDWMETKPNRIK